MIPPDRVVDPGGRDGCRAPISWTADDTHGWPAEPWLPWPPEPEARNAEVMRDDAGSILHLYRELLAARRASAALRTGTLTLLDAADDVVAYERTAGDDVRRVVIAFGDDAPAVPDGWAVEVDGGPALVLCRVAT